MSARFVIGDVFDVLATMPDQSVDLVLTSPPFLALRSYLPADHPDKHKEIGSEATPADFLDTLLALTEEWGRVLAPHGSLAIELGDTYAGSGGAGGDDTIPGHLGFARYGGESRYAADHISPNLRAKAGGWPLPKSLLLIPGLYAASLAYGRNLLNPDHTFEPWRVRNLVAWVRPNPPVGALGDKVRPATSYLTWATRARDRWFDLDAVRTTSQDDRPRNPSRYGSDHNPTHGWGTNDGKQNSAGAPPLDWWKISPNGYQGAHYATFPEELCRIPIEASCPRRVCLTCGKPSRRETSNEYVPHGDVAKQNAEPKASADYVGQQRQENAQGMANDRADKVTTTTGWSSCGCPGTDGIRLDGYHTGTGWRHGVVLDPFVGSGTTLVVATGRGRDGIGIDLDQRNVALALDRMGMFLEVEYHNETRTEGNRSINSLLAESGEGAA